jgi:hypothetical protein
MNDLLTDRVAWRRRGIRHHYVGTLRAGDWGIRLTGRDPTSGIEVTLSIPLGEIENVLVSDSRDDMLVGERCVVLELAKSDPILLGVVGSRPLHFRALARTLGELTHSPALLFQGG